MIGLVIGGIGLLGVANKVLEDILIPRKRMKKGEEHIGVGIDAAFTEEDLKSLWDLGAVKIIRQAQQRMVYIKDSKGVGSCNACGRVDCPGL